MSKKEDLENEIKSLRKLLSDKEDELLKLQVSKDPCVSQYHNHTLNNNEIARYSRQIIVPCIGVTGQEKLKRSSVLIVGCGGLGCPSAQYLAGCGIGRIGVVDYDGVEITNLHRQLLHNEENIGEAKVRSIAKALKRLNKNIQVDEYNVQLTSSNALEILSEYDVIIDATDNVATRYLLNDACVLSGKPLVSGSAVQMEGQLTVYNYLGGPCYRCLFPQPPPPESVSNCGDAGVLGPIPGVIGVLEAQQAIHIILGTDGVLTSRLLLFDGMETVFRTVKLRGKNNSCNVCGETPTIKELIDYEQFCGAPATDKGSTVFLLGPEDRISPEELSKKLEGESKPILIDVRSESEFQICHIPGSINASMKTIRKGRDSVEALMPVKKGPVYVICRRGNDSQIAVTKLKEYFPKETFMDLKGGLHAWARNIDDTFPIY